MHTKEVGEDMACRFALETAKLDFTPVDNVFVTQYMVHASGVQAVSYAHLRCLRQ